MVQFYNGVELSKRLNLSNKEREKAYEFIKLIYEDLKNNELTHINIISRHPLYKTGWNIHIRGGNRESVEKYLYYHILSSDYHGYRFIESLLISETLLSQLDDEHPFFTYNKLISYLGEEFAISKNLLIDMNSYFTSSNVDDKYKEKYYKKSINNELKESHLIKMNFLQLEYLLLDLNPKIVSAGLLQFETEEAWKIFEIYSSPQKELILKSLNLDLSNDELKKIIERRISGKEKNSFELRRYSIYYNRLFKGEELAFRLKTNFKSKHYLKEIITILLGVGGNIYQKGFRGSRDIIKTIQNEELDFLKLGLFYLLEGCEPRYIRVILENYILINDYRGIDFLKRYIVLDGILSLALRHSEYALLEKFIQTIGEDFRPIIENYIDEVGLHN